MKFRPILCPKLGNNQKKKKGFLGPLIPGPPSPGPGYDVLPEPPLIGPEYK